MTWECHASRKMLSKSLEGASTALKLGKRWTRGVAIHRGTGLAAGKQKSASDRHLTVRSATKARRADDERRAQSLDDGEADELL